MNNDYSTYLTLIHVPSPIELEEPELDEYPIDDKKKDENNISK